MINYTNKKIPYIIFCSLVALALSLVFIMLNNKVTDVHASGDIVDNFETVEELEERAELILELEVNSLESISYGDVLFTLSNNDVKKVYKGSKDIKSISILETGGIGELNIDGKKTKVNLIFENNEVLKNKEKVIVYLEKYEGPIAQDSYVILGVHQGKFKLNKNNKITPPILHSDFEYIEEISDLKL